MTQKDRYSNPKAVEAAIKTAARNAVSADPSLTVQERIRMEYFHRFLSRVFSEPEPDWMLKGGTSMLARVPSARTTTDIDLFARARTLDAALADIRSMAAVDLGDYFRFDYTGHTNAVGGDQQTYTEGYQVNFDVYIGANKKDSFHVDLVVGAIATDDVEVTRPANALDLPKLPSSPYRLYPVVDQLADKVCATLAYYNGRPSSREKDLVDIIVLATTQCVSGKKFRHALETESRLRSLTLPTTFEIPATWGAQYAKLASRVPACEKYRHISAAKELIRIFIDPVLDNSTERQSWDHARLGWMIHPDNENSSM